LEMDLQNFIASNTDSYLLASMNSYYRLITHQTAEYYSLGHTLNDETNSILVFKHIGVELITPPPLAQMQQMYVPFNQEVMFPFVPPMPGSVISAVSPQIPIGLPAIPQLPTMTNGYNPRYSYRPIAYQIPQQMYGSRSQGSSGPQCKEQITSGNFKLMKRTESEATLTEEKLKEAETPSSGDVTPQPTSQDLESDLASRESEYQKVRDRIFQSSSQNSSACSSSSASPEVSPVLNRPVPGSPEIPREMYVYPPLLQQRGPFYGNVPDQMSMMNQMGGYMYPQQFVQGYPQYITQYDNRGGYNNRGYNNRGGYRRRGYKANNLQNKERYNKN
jgi:hypothetical protein